MFSKLALPFIGTGLVSLAIAAPSTSSSCKCIPGQSCWPSTAEWTAFNKTVSGRLLKTVPVAAPCYQGPDYDEITCQNVVANWDDSVFQSQFAVGYSYPHTQYCDIPGGNTTTCSLGDSPVYAINASQPAHIVAGVNYAREKNLRLSIKMTGHDLIGRSTGFGSLEIWIASLKNGITFEPTYQPSTKCSANYWTGSAIEVAGGYHWGDVYNVAIANNAVVVGGGCPDVGVIGGYTQGGGHSLAMHTYGLAADQLLEANVVLANGQQVVASPCQNSHLFTALRGGGGGTYGIITSAKIKTHPDSSVTAQSLIIAPKSPAYLPQFMQALHIFYMALPALQDAGLSGYGSWEAYSPTATVGNATSSLTMSLGAFNQTVAQVQQHFAPTQQQLNKYANQLIITTNYTTYDTYFDYYYGTNGVNTAAESGSALVSRLLTKASLSNSTGLTHMLNVTAGAPMEFIFNEICAVGGGAVLTKPDAFSGVNPAWRSTYLINLVAHGWANTADYATVEAAHHDITYVKGAAMTALAPDTGSYMSEGNWQDPNYLQNYYGGALAQLQAAKAKYDPDGVFYCPTCVGSNEWSQKANGQLCKIGKS